MSKVFETMLSIFGILAIVIAGAFVIVFIVDLLISIIDSKGGIFFKRKNKDTAVSNVAATEVKENKTETVIKTETVNTGVDLEAAKKEKEELLKLKQEEESYKNKKINNAVISETTSDINLDDIVFEFDDVSKKVKENKEKDEQIADILEEYEDILEKHEQLKEQEEEVFDFDFASEQAEDTLSIVTDNIVDKNVEIEEAEQNLKLAESEKEKQKALEELDELLGEKEKLVKFAQEAKETLDLMEKEKEQAILELSKRDNEIEELRAQLVAAKNTKPTIVKEFVKQNANGATEEELQERLAVLEERLKANEKELKKVRKEYRPLESVRKSLETYKKKLNTKAAIVAKQNVLLYGVNNYVDIDDEKARKLTEAHELLDGLRMSVRQCEETIENSKERYPVLEQSYKILTRNNKEIRDDIDEINASLLLLNKDKEDENK